MGSPRPHPPAHPNSSHGTTYGGEGEQGAQGQLSVKCWAQRSSRRPSRPRAGMNSSGTDSGPFFFRSRSKICKERMDSQSALCLHGHPTPPSPHPLHCSPATCPHLKGGDLQQWGNADLGHRQCLVDGAGGFGHLRVVMLLEGLEGHTGFYQPSWGSPEQWTSQRFSSPGRGTEWKLQTETKTPGKPK